MRNKFNKNDRGFTIIEVMIVLAIAALILLVVFLAVPALQRSQRNSARKTDASRMAAAVIEAVSSNASGALPSSQQDCNNLVTSVGSLSQFTLAAACPVPAATIPGVIASGNLYLATNEAGGSSGTANGATNGIMEIAEQATCPASAGGSSLTFGAGTAKQVALAYTVEAGNGWAWACTNVQ